MSKGTPIVDGQKFMQEAQTERQWQDSVTDEMTKRGWLWFHVYDSRRSNAGFPDVVAIRAGEIVFCEFKREKGGRESDAQRVWGEALENVQKSIRAAIEAGSGPAKARNPLFHVFRNLKPSDYPALKKVIA